MLCCLVQAVPGPQINHMYHKSSSMYEGQSNMGDLTWAIFLLPMREMVRSQQGGRVAKNVCVCLCLCVCVLLGRCKGACQFKCRVGEREKGLPWCIKILNSKRLIVTARTSVGFGFGQSSL